MRFDHGPQTVDDGLQRGLSSTVHRLAIFLLAVILAACGPIHPTVTLALLGDINLGRGVQPFADSLAYLTPGLSAADLALANLESPLSSRGDRPAAPTEGYNLCTSSARAGLLRTWGLDLLSIANNHSFDCDPDGPDETAIALEAIDITPVGPGMEPVYEDVHGLRLAFLAFDDVSSPLDVDAAVQVIKNARAGDALVIVSIHWGMEYQGGASQRQKMLAQQFAQAGATLVWGHHPHVLQPVEWIQQSPGDSKSPGDSPTLVLYSLGNALFDQGGLADTRQSALAMVTLDERGVTDLHFVPFVIDVIHSRLVAPDAETTQKILGRLQP